MTIAPCVSVTLAPPTGGSGSVATPPPLHAMVLSASTQPAVKITSGSVSCKCETTCASTSKASTSTMFDRASEFRRPVTSIVSVCRPALRPFSVMMGVWISSGRANRSTSVPGPPSTLTRAIPLLTLRLPIQVTEVPVKVNAACAPGTVDCTAAPPLHANQLGSLGVQPGLKLTAALDSSERPGPAGGVLLLLSVLLVLLLLVLLLVLLPLLPSPPPPPPQEISMPASSRAATRFIS